MPSHPHPAPKPKKPKKKKGGKRPAANPLNLNPQELDFRERYLAGLRIDYSS